MGSGCCTHTFHLAFFADDLVELDSGFLLTTEIQAVSMHHWTGFGSNWALDLPDAQMKNPSVECKVMIGDGRELEQKLQLQ